MVNELYHYGVKGQKWGVRRYQNKDGSLTEEGKRLSYYRRRVKTQLRYTDDVNAIVETLSKKDKYYLGTPDNEKWIPDDVRAETVSNIAKTFIIKHGNTPVSMIQIWDNQNPKIGQIAIATNPKYRGKGYTSKGINEAIKWFNSNKNKTMAELQWNNRIENEKSAKIAEAYGFKVKNHDSEYQYRSLYR